jgi:hypothetical protein
MQQASNRSITAPVILLAASLLEVLGMLHHPTAHSANVAQVVEQIASFSSVSAVVHGSLIALMLLTVFGFVDFVLRVGLERPLIRAGLIAYASGVLVMIGAALVSGFIVTNLASLLPHQTPVDLQINAQLLILCRVLNQSCANLAVVAMSAGIVCWSLELGRNKGWSRGVGIFGCVVGLVPALALLSGQLHLDVHGMTQVAVAQAAWNIAVAVWMLRSDVGVSPARNSVVRS